MLLCFDEDVGTLKATERVAGFRWIHAVEPTPTEIDLIAASGAPRELLGHAHDPAELARVDRHASGARLLTVRVPSAVGTVGSPTFSLALILLDERLITVAPRDTGLIEAFVAEQRPALTRPVRAALQLLAYVADEFVKRLRTIDREVERLEDQLVASLRNEEVLELLKYQKSLTHLTTALASNRIMYERLPEDPRFSFEPSDHDLLDAALVELHQAIAMTRISANILSQMMDAFASIISNNLNAVMKILTSLTIILSFPVIVASFYGMNVALPLQAHPQSFPFLLLASLLIAAAVALAFRRMRWL